MILRNIENIWQQSDDFACTIMNKSDDGRVSGWAPRPWGLREAQASLTRWARNDATGGLPLKSDR